MCLPALRTIDWPRACIRCAYHRKLPSTAIIVPGDGKTPFTAAAAAVSGPSSWLLHSIDPRMAYSSCSVGGKRGEGASTKAVVGPNGQLECWRCLSEEWEVPPAVRDADCRVILAVHCHAPLGELWDRLPSPKYCISLPCCGDCGLLKHAPPIVSYRDPVRTRHFTLPLVGPCAPADVVAWLRHTGVKSCIPLQH